MLRDICREFSGMGLRDTAMSLGMKIKALRNQKNLSQEDLASMVKMTIGNISKIERNIVEPSTTTIKKIALALGVTTDSLLFDDEERALDNDLLPLFNALKELPAEKMAYAKEFLESLVLKNQPSRKMDYQEVTEFQNGTKGQYYYDCPFQRYGHQKRHTAAGQ